MSHYSKLLFTIALLVISAPLAANGKEHEVVVYGGTAGGVTAATSAARGGRSVVLIEPGRHLGGLTTGGLGATDHGKQEAIGGMSRNFYQRVKKHYDDPASWKYEKREDYRSHKYSGEDDLMWFFEPSVAEKILGEMLREAGVTVVFNERLNRAAGVKKTGPRITSVTMESGKVFAARVFIDATYEGDLMAAAGVSYHVGREGNATYGETLNGVQTKRVPYSGHNIFRPLDPYVIPGDKTSGLLFGVQSEGPGEEGGPDHRVQAYCFRLVMTDVPENRLPFPKPDGYDPKTYELLLRYLLLDGSDKTFPDHPDPEKIENPALGRDPNTKIMPNRKTDQNSKGAISSNFVGQNYAYPDADYATREKIIDAHRRWQQGMIWFMQNDPRVPARYRDPMQNWGLPKDEFTDTNHWPHQLYIREARRMIGDYVMIEQDCNGERKAKDSIGLGSYTMDSHVTQRFVNENGHVRNEGNLGGRVPGPYPISYRSLTPKREQCDNLLVPVCMSASHVAYGSIRMEPVYMILGESQGTAAVMAIDKNLAVQDVPYAPLRERLVADKQRLE